MTDFDIQVPPPPPPKKKKKKKKEEKTNKTEQTRLKQKAWWPMRLWTHVWNIQVSTDNSDWNVTI